MDRGQKVNEPKVNEPKVNESKIKDPKIEISLLELLGILRIATRHLDPLIIQEPKRRIATEFILALNNGGHIDNKTTKEVVETINPSLRNPQVIVDTRSVPYWWPEEMGANGLMWRDQKNLH
jgi:hypothetical protein